MYICAVAHMQCREPRKGHQKVQILKKTTVLYPFPLGVVYQNENHIFNFLKISDTSSDIYFVFFVTQIPREQGVKGGKGALWGLAIGARDMFEPGNYRYKYILYKGEPLGTLPHGYFTIRASRLYLTDKLGLNNLTQVPH